MAIIFGALSGEWAGVRSLRVLPLSTMKLALLMLSIPVTAAVVVALIAVLFAGPGHLGELPLISFVVRAVAVAGFGSLALAIVLYIVGGWRIVVFMGSAIVGVMTLQLVHSPLWLFVIGLVTGLPAFALLLRGLRKSSAFYQPRRMFNAGMGYQGMS
jgi:hypothetical protein